MNGSTGKCTKEWKNEWMSDCANDNLMDDWLKNFHCLKVIWLVTSKRPDLPTVLYSMGVYKQKKAYYTCKRLKTSKHAILSLFLENFAICAVFTIRYVQNTYLGQQLRGYRESYHIKMAYYTIKWPKTSKKGYLRRFFEISPFNEISTVGSVKDTCLGIQSWGSWTVALQSE